MPGRTTGPHEMTYIIIALLVLGIGINRPGVVGAVSLNGLYISLSDVHPGPTLLI